MKRVVLIVLALLWCAPVFADTGGSMGPSPLVGKVFCDHCGGPFPIELVSGPHCGAPAPGRHA